MITVMILTVLKLLLFKHIVVLIVLPLLVIDSKELQTIITVLVIMVWLWMKLTDSVGEIVNLKNKILMEEFKCTGMTGTTKWVVLMVTIDLNVCHVDKLEVFNTHSSRVIVVMVLVILLIFQTSMTYFLIWLVVHLVLLINIVLGVLICKLPVVG